MHALCGGLFITEKSDWEQKSAWATNFPNDIACGKNPITIKKNMTFGEDTYNGDTICDIRHGYGKYTWSDGDVYEGDVIDIKLTNSRLCISINLFLK